MTRRIAVRLAGAAAAAVLASGCITQPMDESALELTTEQLGETPSPIVDDEAERFVTEARDLNRLHAGTDRDPDKVVWTKREVPNEEVSEGGLVRSPNPTPDDGDAEDETARNSSSGDSDAGDSAGSSDDATSGTPVEGAPRNSGDDDDASADASDRNADDGDAPSGASGSGGDRTGSRPRGDDDDDSLDGKGEEASPTPRPQPEPEFTALAGAGDEQGDASGQAPRYADIRQLLIESDGKRARVTVAVAGRVPQALAGDEVQGVGVDFYRSDERESDYQLFADGDDNGWRAFLHTPDGLVQYPGSFAIGGRVFVFEVPWSALGGKKTADVDMFIDWSKRGSPTNKATSDRAPDKDRLRVAPQ